MKASAASNSRDEYLSGFDPKPLNKIENAGPAINKIAAGDAVLKKVENEQIVEAFRAVGSVIEEARERAGLTRKEACALMFVAEAQYSRWVSGAANDRPSLAHLWLLPPTFWFHLLQITSAKKNLRRMALAEFIGGAADAVLMGAL